MVEDFIYKYNGKTPFHKVIKTFLTIAFSKLRPLNHRYLALINRRSTLSLSKLFAQKGLRP